MVKALRDCSLTERKYVRFQFLACVALMWMFFKDCLGGRAGFIWLACIFSPKQRLRSLFYCAPPFFDFDSIVLAPGAQNF